MHHPTAVNQQGLGKHVLQDVIKIFLAINAQVDFGIWRLLSVVDKS